MSVWNIVLGFFLGVTAAGGIFYKSRNKKNEEIKCLADKYLEMFLVMDRWIKNKQNRKKISDYLKERGFQSVIIYGVGYIGKRLYDELIDEEFEIKYLVDKNKIRSTYFENREIKQIDEDMDSADAVIVTAIYYFDEIEDNLKQRFGCPILSFADLIYKM